MDIDEEIKVLRECIDHLRSFCYLCKLKTGASDCDCMVVKMLRQDRRRLKRKLLLKGHE